MSKKLRYGKKFHSKKKKMKRPASPAPAVQAVAAEGDKPASAVPLPASSAPKTKIPAVRYSYVGAEIRRIGILAGIMFIVLLVLALVL